MSLDVEINSKQYSLVPGGDGTKISTRPVQQFVQPIRDTGRTRPEDVAAYESFVVPNLAYGFGRARINSDVAFDSKEYRRFFNSTCDTRWMDRIYLPILSEDAAQAISKTDSTELDVVKASTSLSGELYSLWSGPTNGIYRSQFTGAFTTLAEDLDDSETGIDVTDASNLAVDDIITVDSEKMLITAISTNTLTVTREVFGTSAATHDNGDAVTTDTWGNNQRLWPIVTLSNNHKAASSSYTFNTNIPADTDIFVACVMGFDAAASIGDPNSIEIGSEAMTKAVANTQGNNYAGIYYKTSPNTGATVSFSTQFQTGTSQHIDEPTFTFFSISGANASSPSVATNAESLSSTTSLSNALSTAVGDICIRAVAVNDDVTVTLGPDQIAGGTSSASTFTHHAAYQIATDTTTTMTGTLSEAESGATVAAAFATGSASVPVDMTISGGATVSLIMNEDDHKVFTGTTLATTQPTAGMLASDVTDGQNVDAGLFATIGGELVLAVHHGTDITFFSSTNNGVTWADESIDIPSANGPQGLAAYPDIDGEDKLYVGTSEGLYIVDTSPSTWTFQLIMPMTNSTDNCRRMTVHEGSLWFAQGVDNDSPAPIYKLTVQGNSRVIESGFGLSYGDGVTSDMLGPVRWMKSSGDQLFIAVGGGAASRNARILAWNGKGWHHMYKNASANEKIDWIDVGSGDDGVPRLHFAEREGTTESDVKFLEQPLVNPRSGVSIKRAADGQFIELPYYDLGMPHESKNFLSAHLSADDLTASHEIVEFHYGLNGADRDTVDLGDFTSAVSKLQFASGAGVSAKDIGIMLKLNREDGDTSKTPKIKDIIIEGLVVPTILYEHQMTIDLEQTAEDTGQSVETVISNIETLVESVIQTQFKFGQVSKYVTLDRERSAFSFNINAWDAGGAPNALAERSGTFNCVLVEKGAE